MKNLFVSLTNSFAPRSSYAMADYASSTYNPSPYTNNATASNSSFHPKRLKRFFKKSPYLPLIVVVILVGGVAFFAIKNIANNTTTVSAPNVLSASDKKVGVEKPITQQELNKTFAFPLKDQAGKEVSKFSYTIQSVELRNEIVVKGQKATAIKGRVFLVINLKITNNYDKTIQINSRDFIRLIINGSTEKLAPDIHNDPVEVQAISTKYTRVGLAINDTDKNIVLQVGEITGKKELINLDLR